MKPFGTGKKTPLKMCSTSEDNDFDSSVYFSEIFLSISVYLERKIFSSNFNTLQICKVTKNFLFPQAKI